jgi:hypothetical protein
MHSYTLLYSLPQNQEFPSTALSEEIEAKLLALAASRRTGDVSPGVNALNMLPPSAKIDPLADMTTTVNGVATGTAGLAWSCVSWRTYCSRCERVPIDEDKPTCTL